MGDRRPQDPGEGEGGTKGISIGKGGEEGSLVPWELNGSIRIRLRRTAERLRSSKQKGDMPSLEAHKDMLIAYHNFGTLCSMHALALVTKFKVGCYSVSFFK